MSQHTLQGFQPKQMESLREKLIASRPEAAKAHLVAGRAIYYGDPQYPGQIVKEYPDGRRQLVDINEQSVVTVIKEI
jgi:hypothetical protein